MRIFAIASARKVLGVRRMMRLMTHYWELACAVTKLVKVEENKRPSRTEILNWIAVQKGFGRYLEIGVRDPRHNFDLVCCARKTSVDPGLELASNPVAFQMTSDEFYEHWKGHKSKLGKYELVFLDGLHRADQVARDIEHAIEMTEDYGIIVLHDCNPPHESLAREDFGTLGVAGPCWNGTTWKAVYRYFHEGSYETFVVDADWGVGIIDKSKRKQPKPNPNPFYEFDQFLRTKGQSGLLRSWDFVQSWLREETAGHAAVRISRRFKGR